MLKDIFAPIKEVLASMYTGVRRIIFRIRLFKKSRGEVFIKTFYVGRAESDDKVLALKYTFDDLINDINLSMRIRLRQYQKRWGYGFARTRLKRALRYAKSLEFALKMGIKSRDLFQSDEQLFKIKEKNNETDT